MEFRPIDWRVLGEDPFTLFAKDWTLITAGKLGASRTAAWNTMTASWGGLGHLWNQDVVFCFVRPSRYTFGFMESCERFSLSFLGEEHREALQILGSLSGRDGDKVATAALSPRQFEGDSGEWISFREARLVLGCRKIHAQDLDPECFIDPAIAPHYAKGDWHRMYVGAIEAAWFGD